MNLGCTGVDGDVPLVRCYCRSSAVCMSYEQKNDGFSELLRLYCAFHYMRAEYILLFILYTRSTQHIRN